MIQACSIKDKKIHSQQPQETKVKITTQASKAVGIETQKVEKRNLAIGRVLPGTVEPDIGKEVDVSSRVSGRIDKLFVSPGQPVNKGQVLAFITSQEVSDLETKVLVDQAQLDTAKAQEARQEQVYLEQVHLPKALMDAKASLKTAKSRRDLMESQFKRISTLYEEKIAPQKDLFGAKVAFEHAETELEQAKGNFQREEAYFKNKAVLRGPYQLAQAERIKAEKELQALKSQLKFLGIDAATLSESLKDGSPSGVLKIVAPIKGVLSFFDVAPGELIEADKPIFRIIDLSTVLVSADVPQSEISIIHVGNNISIKVQGIKEPFPAVVNIVSSHVDPATRTLTVRARLENPNGVLKPGMFVEAKLEDKANVVLSVPKAAIQSVNDKKVVFVVTPEGFEQSAVVTGAEDSVYAEVISGIKEGDEVATQGSLMLKTELSSKDND
jgi:cobalt-zinc-cadmium efflux system membrane fusion protein